MRFITFALLLLLSAATPLFAKGFKVNKPPEKFTQPAGTVDRVSMRTLTGKTFQDSAHFNAGDYNHGQFVTMIGVAGAPPIHYDSAGKMVEIDYTSTPDNGYQVVNAGRFVLRYKPTGEIRFERKQGFVEFIPAFDTTDVGVEFNIHAHGLKANYYLDADSPNRLAWGFDFTSNHENEGQGKGRVKNAVGSVVAEFEELKAWDSAVPPNIIDLFVNFTGDSLTVLVDTAGAVFPITVDPTVRDSVVAAASGQTEAISAVYATARNAATGNVGLFNIGVKHVLFSGDFFVTRGHLTFPMTHLPEASAVSSATLYIYLSSNPPTVVYDSTIVIQGTWTGAAVAPAWHDDFAGWAGSGAYSLTELAARLVFNSGSADGEYKTTALTADGRTAVKDAMGVDSLRLSLINARDVSDTEPSGVNWQQAFEVDLVGGEPYIIIDYTADAGGGPASVAGITTTPASVAGLTSRSKTAGIE